jgi:hypothetical protein
MRSDMAKIVTERPRSHSRIYSYKDIRRKNNRCHDNDMGNFPSHQSMRIPYGWDVKNFSDLLGPIVGYLIHQCGKKWDDVYSDICEHLKPSCHTQQHILDHIKNYVNTNLKVDEFGNIYDPKYPPASYMRQFDGSYKKTPKDHNPFIIVDDFYVDPRDGILRKPNKKSRHGRAAFIQEKFRQIFRYIGPEKELYKIRGIWYWAVFETVRLPHTWTNPYTHEITTYNRVEKDHKDFNIIFTYGWPMWRCLGYKESNRKETYHAGERYRSAKKQLSFHELRFYDLVND